MHLATSNVEGGVVSEPLPSLSDSNTNTCTKSKSQLNTTAVESQDSVIQFKFFQVNEEWQKRLCSQLDLTFCSAYNNTRGSRNTILTKPSRLLRVIGDGNCLFRCMSYVLTGSQDHQMQVRSRVCSHMHSIANLVLTHISHDSTHNYIADKKMNINGVWGTDVEVLTFANMCNVNVYTYSVQHGSWNVYPPTFSVSHFDVFLESVYLRHTGDHYDVVASTSQ